MRQFDCEKDSFDYTFNYNLEETRKLQSLFSTVREDQPLTIDHMRQVALWKYNRVLDVPEKLLERVEKLAKKQNITVFDQECKAIITELCACDGIGMPLASAILKFLRPDLFPIIDVRAYRALYGKKIYSNQYTVEKYYDYVKKIYDLKEKMNCPLSLVDEQLYEFDKKYNGSISSK